MALNSNDLAFFQTLVAGKSLADAARRLGVSGAAVSLRLQQIESRLGVRLLERSGRRMYLTDEGRLLRERAETLLSGFLALEEDLRARRGAVVGTLRVVAPLGFGRAYVAPLASELRRRHPNLRIELTLSDRIGRLPEEAWDVAVHVGALPDSNLALHRLAPNERWLCAAPGYLAKEGTPSTPEELSAHACIALRENDEDVTAWRFANRKRVAAIRIEPILGCNDGDVVRDWALRGDGIILRSEWSVAQDVAAGRLKRLLPEFEVAAAPVVALTSKRRHVSARAAKFIANLKTILSPAPWRVRPR
jgi:DNA-binding transcriptional LysR family regulator